MFFPLILFSILLPFILADDFGNSWETATAIPMHNAVYGTIEYNGDWDFFKIKLIAGRAYQITVYASFTNTFLRIYDPNMNHLYDVDNTVDWNPQAGFVALITGDYYLGVVGPTIFDLGTYLIAVVDLSYCSATCTCNLKEFSLY